MPENRSGIRIFTLSEANASLEACQRLLASLRETRTRIVALQARVDIEELTASGPSRDQAAIEALLRDIEKDAHAFHQMMEEMNSIGCELKDLEKGLIDFYGMRANEMIFWCWKEGEQKISHWHTLESGFQGRQQIED